MRWCLLAAMFLTCGLLLTAAKADDEPVLPTIKTIENKMLDAEAIQGKVIVIEFWATWCGTCAAELPHMKKLYERYHGDDVLFIGMAEETDQDIVVEYVRQHEIPWHVALDDNHTFAKRFKIKALPRALIIGRDGSLAWRGIPKDMDSALRDAMNND